MMKLFVMSDLHVDTSRYNYDTVVRIAEMLVKDPPEVLIVLSSR